jgi:toxin ParE1/3/4
MKYALRFSTKAVRDISEVLDFTVQQFGEKQRGIYQQIVRDALEELAADPENPRSKRRPEIHPDARTMHLARRGKRARHLFLYRIKNSRFVDIARLLHDSMEIRRHLPPDFASVD